MPEVVAGHRPGFMVPTISGRANKADSYLAEDELDRGDIALANAELMLADGFTPDEVLFMLRDFATLFCPACARPRGFHAKTGQVLVTCGRRSCVATLAGRGGRGRPKSQETPARQKWIASATFGRKCEPGCGCGRHHRE